jgi:hypothetical protein
VVRVSRAIRQDNRSVVLLGERGSGKSSIINFACALAGYDTISSKASRTSYSGGDFNKDLKHAMAVTGVEEKHLVFIIKEEHINFELMEKVVDALKIGASPLLYSIEEIEKIIQDVRINALMKGIMCPYNKITNKENHLMPMRFTTSFCKMCSKISILCFALGHTHRFTMK